MTLEQLKTQLERTEKDLTRIEERKKELLGKRTELKLQIAEKEAEKAGKVMKIIKDNFGELTEENLEKFRRIMEGQPGTAKGLTAEESVPEN